MSRYFFDIRENGEFIRDEAGVELSSLDEARREAQRALAEMAEELMRHTDQMSLVIEIRTGSDQPHVEAIAHSQIKDLK